MRIVGLVLLCLLPILPVACSDNGGGVVQPQQLTLDDATAQDLVVTTFGGTEFVSEMPWIFMQFLDLLIVGSGSYTVECDGSGSTTVLVTDQEPVGEFSVGDTATVTFNSCRFIDDEEPTVFTGRIIFSISEVSLGPQVQLAQLIYGVTLPPPWEFKVPFTFQNTKLTYTDGSVMLNGDATISASSADNETFVFVVEGDHLAATVVDNADSFSVEFDAYRFDETYNLVTGEYAYGGTGDMFYSEVPVWVHIETAPLLTGEEPAFPDAGVIYLEGPAPIYPSVTFTALSSTSVRIEVDKDGDGTADSTLNKTWAELLQ